MKIYSYFGLLLIFLFSLTPAAGNAALITQQFYVEIDSVVLSVFAGPEVTQTELIKYFPGPSVGERYAGTVSYDNSRISVSGQYIIGYTATWVNDPLADEWQDWGISWNGTGFGWMADIYIPPRLYFIDGKLTGIDSIYHEDQWPNGLENEGFLGTDYVSSGGFIYMFDGPQGTFDGTATFIVHGTLHVQQISEPATMMLLGFSIAVLASLTGKKFRGNRSTSMNS